ncbi:MAG TPA: SH3 domain-containing protein [Rhodocyclaceae bacterium]
MKRGLLLLLAGLALPALALDYRSVTEPAVLYDGPTSKARKLFIVATGTPVELVLSQPGWSKVRDGKGDLLWIESRLLSPKRMLMVKVEKAQVRAQADDKAPLAFEAETNVLLELVEPGPAGWVKVKHRDGQAGFVRASQVWGL